MEMFLVILLLFTVINVITPASSPTEDYAWRDYQDYTPSDAFIVGLDSKRRKLFIGQALFEHNLIPGKIIEGDKNVYFEYFDKENTASDNVRILCISQPEKFKWFPTRSNELLSSEKVLIRGGFEPNVSTYVGRIKENGVTNLGKVICHSSNDCYGLYTSNNGTTTLSTDFEVLTYDGDLTPDDNNNSNGGTCKDSRCTKITVNIYN